MFVTIQKLSLDVGLDESYIRKMIKDKTLTAYKKDGYKRIYVDINEFEATIKPINQTEPNFDLEQFEV
jgi:hypothetical protein